MKYLVVLFLVVAVCGQARAQHEFMDAVNLSGHLHNGKLELDTTTIRFRDAEVRRILDQYEIGPDNANDDPYLQRFIDRELLDRLHAKFPPSGGISVGSGYGTGMWGDISSVGGMAVPPSLVNAVTGFLVNRTKQELEIAFFDQFRKMLDDPKNADALLLFPNTHKLLEDAGEELYDFNVYNALIRQAFQKDLESVAGNMPKVFNSSNYAPYFDKNPDLKFRCVLGFQIAAGLQMKHSLGEILENVSDDDMARLVSDGMPGMRRSEPKSPKVENFVASITFMKALSTSLKDTIKNRYWVSSEEFAQIENPAVFSFYIALFAKKIYKIQFTEGTELTSISRDIANLGKLLPNDRSLFNFIRNEGAQLIAVDDEISEMKRAKPGELGFDKSSQLVTDVFGALAGLQGLLDIPGMGFSNKRQDALILSEYLRLLDLGKNIAEMAVDMKYRHYSAGFVNAYNVYNEVFPEITIQNDSALRRWYQIYPDELVIYKKILDARRKGRNIDSALMGDIEGADRYQAMLQLKRVADFKHKLLKYGSFAAAACEAKGPGAMDSLILSYALPPGSSRIKRENKFNLCLNAYVGIYGGYEKISGIDKPLMSIGQVNSFGVAAPIGICISRGNSKFLSIGKGHASTSLFVTILDLGALVSYRFSHDTSVSQLPNIQVKDIISPGVFLSYGLPKCPISLSAGVQVGPNLRNVSGAAATVSFNSEMYYRYSLSCLVDLPLFNFHTVQGGGR